MEQDFSWARSGVEYLQLYQQAMSTHLSLQRIA
jgi:starch synthase